MANVRKRILQLTALESASLNTSLVGVDDGTTYRIELDTLADAVTARVNILDRDRLSSLESVTSSFETKGRSVISSSAQITAFGFISTSVDITALNSFTSSQNATNTAFTNGINSRLQTSSFNDFSASVHTEILAATNEQDLSYLVTTSSFNTYTASISTGSLVDRLSSLENNTGSYLTSLNGTISSSAQITSFGFISESVDISLLNSFTSSQSTLNTAFTNGINARLQTSSFNDFSTSVDSRIIAATNEQSFNGLISGSSQLTSSYDTRYVLSGSITQTTWDNIESKPAGIISSSAQITAFGFISSSQTIDTGSFLTTSSYNADSASFDTRINSITLSGSNLNYFLEAYANVTYTLPGTFTEDPCRYSVVSVNENVPSSWFDTSTYTFTPQKAGYWEIAASYDVYRNTEASIAIKKNGSIVASAGSFNAVAQEIKKIIYLNGSSDYINIINVGGAALQRAQFQSRSWFQAKFVGNTSGSTDLLIANNTFTGNNTFEGTTRFETVGGDEGGEIEFGVPQTNTSLSTRVVADVYQNRFRIFDGNTNGVFIDLSKAPTGVAGEIAWKTSGFVNAGTFLTLDNLKVTCTTSGFRGLSVGAVSTNFTANIAGWFGYSGGGGGASANNVTYTTTAAASAFGWGFNTEGDASNYIITDKTNSRVYRVTLMIGFGFNNNFISIERLH